jgi:hypothetical protein
LGGTVPKPADPDLVDNPTDVDLDDLSHGGLF